MKRLFAAALLCATVLAPSVAALADIIAATDSITGCPTRSASCTIMARVSRLGSFAYYDGPATIFCRRSAAAYLGQDRRRHPCY